MRRKQTLFYVYGSFPGKVSGVFIYVKAVRGSFPVRVVLKSGTGNGMESRCSCIVRYMVITRVVRIQVSIFPHPEEVPFVAETPD